jgi:hypothetical protein
LPTPITCPHCGLELTEPEIRHIKAKHASSKRITRRGAAPKLSPAQREAIRCSGQPPVELAETYNVTVRTIYRVRETYQYPMCNQNPNNGTKLPGKSQ